MTNSITITTSKKKNLRFHKTRPINRTEIEKKKLTTPIMEESNWTSQRRRSSAALRMRCLESESSSFFAISDRSIFGALRIRDLGDLRSGFWNWKKWKAQRRRWAIYSLFGGIRLFYFVFETLRAQIHGDVIPGYFYLFFGAETKNYMFVVYAFTCMDLIFFQFYTLKFW